MRHTLLDTIEGRRKFVLVLDAEEEAMATIRSFARRQGLGGASIAGIGAFARCAFGHFNPSTAEFTRNEIAQQAEVLALIGNIADPAIDPGNAEGDMRDSDPRLHVHCVVGLRDASALGGHLIEAIVRPTLELIIEESPVHMRRGHDRASGLVLLQPNQARD